MPKTTIPIDECPLTTKAFIAFIAKKPKSGEYNYVDCAGCPIASFFRSNRYSEVGVDDIWIDCKKGGKEYHISTPRDWEHAVVGLPRTYGALLGRLKQIQELAHAEANNNT